MYMIQYDAHGRFIRRAKYNAAVASIWAQQVPYGRIVLANGDEK